MNCIFAILVILMNFASTYVKAGADEHNQEYQEPLNWKQGSISLLDNKAILNIQTPFRFLDSKQSQKFLQTMGNTNVEDVLGIIASPDHDGWFVVVSYVDTGYVSDSEASTIDYSKLLKSMKKAMIDENFQRQKNDLEKVELLGWAAQPKYDQVHHTLHWAKELRFQNHPENVLNYNFRILGRRGVLILNAVAGMDQLAAIERASTDILTTAQFTAGNRYEEFDSNIDQTAGYGLAALIAGGAAAKAAVQVGFFKGFITLLLAAKKVILLAIAALLANFKKLFPHKNKTQ